ncbi:hypothetical protein [Sphingobium sp. CFD-2]|uniref:hypothetical protein n=1 Tax=Sphingobium sp. CFD-2 TaxID=2878542 RepID=UPI00214CC7EA|nr:hypothetical protein [Sphingobium sp. CFD-2]
MTDFANYRHFSIEAVVPAGWGALGGGRELIGACAVKHLGYWDDRLCSVGSLALANWIMEHRELIAKPKPNCHPLNRGMMIERILVGEVLPADDFALALANMTEGVVLPEMFGQIEADTASSAPQALGAGEKAPDAAPVSPCQGAAPVPSDDRTAELPPLGALGGPLPSGRLFHPIADSRFPEGFVLTGCGMSLCLDESTAKAMQTALADGLSHIQNVRRAGLGVAA